MKTLGLIGGMSWESTAIYYRHLNEIARERLGGLHSAKLLLWSFDFADVADLQQAGDWEGATALMIDAARRLEAGGAEALVICTNTMHRMASALETAVDLPLIHIADATAGRMKAAGAMRPALLGFRQVSRQILSGGTDQPWRAVSSSGDGEHIAQGGDPLDIDCPSPGCGHVLLAPGGRSEEVAHLVVSPAEAGGAGVSLEASHRLVTPFYSPVILFQMVV
jgi:hypothetical protein